MGRKKLATVNQKECVACGVCMKNCPKQAIEIYKGLYAKIDADKCVGCSKCQKVCPASVIEMEETQ